MKRKKPKEYISPWFAPGVSPGTSPAPLIHATPSKEKVTVNYPGAVDTNVKYHIQLGMQKFEAFLSGAAVTPAVGMFRIEEHVFFSLPSIVHSKVPFAGVFFFLFDR